MIGQQLFHPNLAESIDGGRPRQNLHTLRDRRDAGLDRPMILADLNHTQTTVAV
jgi:hypothetical protein